MYDAKRVYRTAVLIFASRMSTSTPIEDDGDHDEISCYSIEELDRTKEFEPEILEVEHIFPLTRSEPGQETMNAITREELLIEK